MAAAAPGAYRQIETMQPRILIADDQPDVLRACALASERARLRDGNGSVTSGVTRGRDSPRVRSSVDGPELRPRYDFGARGTRSARAIEDDRRRAADCGDDRLGDSGHRRRGHAARRHRFCREALDEHEAAGNSGKADCAGTRTARVVHAARRRRARRTGRSRRTLHEQEHEIAEARSIQEGFLPKEIPQVSGYEIASAWQSARVVGGDYFDVLVVRRRDTLGLCIADVAGKGMPAALLMSNLQAAVRGLASPTLPPDRTLRAAECAASPQYRERPLHHVFLRAARWAGRDSAICKCRAQRADRAASRMARIIVCKKAAGCSACFRIRASCSERRGWSLGDRVVLFTDGVTEARNLDDDEFGEERLVRLLAENRGSGAKEIQKKILHAAAEFSQTTGTTTPPC